MNVESKTNQTLGKHTYHLDDVSDSLVKALNLVDGDNYQTNESFSK